MKRLVVVLATLVALAACDSTDTPQPIKKKPRVDIPLTKAEADMARSGNEFAYHLFRQVSRQQTTPGNTFISPISVSYVLAMLNNGAAGNTRKEILQVLGLEGCTPDQVNLYHQKMLVASRELDPQVELLTANSIWLRKEFPPLATFADVNKRYYEAEVLNVDFSDPRTLGQINGWAARHTNDRIPAILDKLDPATAICLLNALCFRGEWETPFERDQTVEGLFTNADHSTTPASMMRRTFITGCYVDETCSLLSLPYGNGAFSMSILLPAEGETTLSVIDRLDEERWSTMYKGRTGYKVRLRLPRFSTAYEVQLDDALKALGLPSLFDPATAELPGVYTGKSLFITRALQKARIEVDEEGTRAEVVTEMDGMVSSPGPVQVPEFDFVVDRPFVYLIREISSGAIFFVGEVNRL